jgi:hypothetical protein
MVLQAPYLQVYALLKHGLSADVILMTKICHGELNKKLNPTRRYRLSADRSTTRLAYCRTP